MSPGVPIWQSRVTNKERKLIHNQVCLYDRAGANVDGRGRRSEWAGEGPDGRERVKKIERE